MNIQRGSVNRRLCCVSALASQNPLFKVFGAVPLENVVRNLKQLIIQDLEHCLAEHAPPPLPENPDIYTLPPLVIDGHSNPSLTK